MLCIQHVKFSLFHLIHNSSCYVSGTFLTPTIVTLYSSPIYRSLKELPIASNILICKSLLPGVYSIFFSRCEKWNGRPLKNTHGSHENNIISFILSAYASLPFCRQFISCIQLLNANEIHYFPTFAVLCPTPHSKKKIIIHLENTDSSNVPPTWPSPHPESSPYPRVPTRPPTNPT